MNELEEVRKWLQLGYETYGPRGARAIASAMGLPTRKVDITSPGNGEISKATKESDIGGSKSRLYEFVDSDPLRPQRAASQSASTCPKEPPRGSPGWRSYGDSGDPDVFHCGFDGYLEDREPTPDHPIAECFYDEHGELVDKSHPYAECRGTPDSYPASDWFGHGFLDPGGPLRAGIPALLESRRHAADNAIRRNREFLRKQGYPPYGVGPFRAPLPPR